MEGELIKPKCPPFAAPSKFERVKWSKEDYNNEPVFYCKRCHSLAIKAYDEGGISEYCGQCGSTNISTTTIEEWLKLTKE
jgi:hypothetical protein|nr:MAG TPA: TFIIB Transcription factor zinc-finger [Crassvirales sp.]